MVEMSDETVLSSNRVLLSSDFVMSISKSVVVYLLLDAIVESMYILSVVPPLFVVLVWYGYSVVDTLLGISEAETNGILVCMLL